MAKLFKLDCVCEDLPAVLGQDDFLFGCPPLHLSKGFQGNRGSVKSFVSLGTKWFFTYSQAETNSGLYPKK